MKINKKLAVRLAKVCLWAYDFDESREDELLAFNKRAHIKDICIKDTQSTPTSFAAIVECEDIVIVAFQGTITEFGLDGVFRLDTLVDWIQNFKVKQVPDAKSQLPGNVHFGFLKQLNLIYDQVVAQLKILGSKKRIVVTGHSQGGAIANLATKRLLDDGFMIQTTYTFAAPRAGDASFAKSISSLVHRIEFGLDIVPHVPPLTNQQSLFGTFLLGILKEVDLPGPLNALASLTKKIKKNSYQSIGSLTYRAEDGNLQPNLTRSQERKLFKARKRKLILAGKRLVRHHGLENYINMFS